MRDQRGTAMVYTLLALLVLSIFLSIVYERVIDLMRSSRDWLWKEKVLVAAESGLAMSEARLLDDPFWVSGDGAAPELKFSLDDAEVVLRTVRFRVPDIVWTFSTGSYKREKKEVVRPVKIDDPTLFAMLARKEIRLGLGTIVRGSIFGSDIRTESGSDVAGSIISTGGLDIEKEHPEAMVFDSAVSPPDVPSIDLKRVSKSWTKKVEGTVLASPAPDTGMYAAAGDFTIRDAALSGVSLWIPGNLTLEGKVVIRGQADADTPVLVVEKNLTGTLAGARIRGVVVVRGKATLRGEGLITGTLIADEIDLSGGVVVQSFDAVPNEKRPRARFWKRTVRRIKN